MRCFVKSVGNAVEAEFWKIVTFGVVGLASLGLTVALYAVISRVLWQHGPRTVQYSFVVLIVTWVNYEANRFFTFRQPQRTAGSVGRFATVAGIAAGLNSALFWLGHEIFHLGDFYVIIVNAFLVALFTFTSHRLFTFHERPWRWVRG